MRLLAAITAFVLAGVALADNDHCNDGCDGVSFPFVFSLLLFSQSYFD